MHRPRTRPETITFTLPRPPRRARSEPLPAHKMHCHEVWGGNAKVDQAVDTCGIDAWVYARPYADQDAGGDLHYLTSCASGLLTRVVLADVSGHGTTVASFAQGLRRLIGRYVNTVDHAILLDRLNEAIFNHHAADGFVTALVASYLANERLLTLSNAGHPPPMIYRAIDGSWSLLDARADAEVANIPMGITAPVRYDTQSTHLGVGDVVVLYTDSLTEARDLDGNPLGIDGLLDLVRPLRPDEPHEFKHALLDALEDRVGAPQDTDDVTILVLRANDDDDEEDALAMTIALARITWRILTRPLPGARDIPWPDVGPLAPLGRWFGSHRARSRSCQSKQDQPAGYTTDAILR